MLGLGAGIDYALLIIGRYREQVAAGDSRRDASAKSAATSGASVVAAGLVVMLAIAGLLVIGIPFIGKLGLAAAIAVGAVVVSAITILPIMIGALGRWLKPKKPEHVLPSPGFGRWGEIVTAKPWVSIAAGVLVLLLFAAPGHAAAPRPARRRQPARGQAPAGRLRPPERARSARAPTARSCSRSTSRRAARTTRRSSTSCRRPSRRRRAWPQVAPAAVSQDGEMATIFAIPKTAPQDQATSDLLADLRENVIPEAVAGTPLKVYVGGNTAGFEDFSRQGRLAPAGLHRGRDRPLGAAADHGLPLTVGPAGLGRLQPALGGRGVRRRHRGLPAGRGREPDRRRLRRADRLLHPGDAVRDPVRLEHGLQRLPALADPRGLQRGRPPARVA